MKRFQLALATMWLSAIVGIAATSLGNVPISQLPIATNVVEQAWFPIIQPLPGRTTNDNFRVNLTTLRQSLGTNSVDSLWTNSAGAYLPAQLQYLLRATNISSDVRLESLGEFTTSASFNGTLALGVNNLQLTGIGYALLASTTTVASDTTLRLSLGSGYGQHVWLVHSDTNSFTLQNLDTLFDDPTRYVWLSGGTWTPTTIGEALELMSVPFGWAEMTRTPATTATNIVTGSTLWGTDGTYLFPLTNSWFTMLPPPGLIVDTNSLTWYGIPGINDGIALLSLGPDTGGAFKTLDVGVFDKALKDLECAVRYFRWAVIAFACVVTLTIVLRLIEFFYCQ